jgi:hypothetical protein
MKVFEKVFENYEVMYFHVEDGVVVLVDWALIWYCPLILTVKYI